MNDPLAALRARFVARCAEDRAALAAPDLPQDERRRIVHRIAGAAGMFGFRELGAVAARLDDAAAEGQAPDPADERALLAALADAR